MSAKERMLEYLDYKNVSQYGFSKATGLSNGFLKSGNSISSENMELISNKYTDLSLMWLITGKGNMLIDEGPPAVEPGVERDTWFMRYGNDTKSLLSLSISELNREIAVATMECREIYEDYYRLKEALNKLEWDAELLSKFVMPPMWSERLDKLRSDFEAEHGDSDEKIKAAVWLTELKEEYRDIKYHISYTIYAFEKCLDFSHI
ncbi:MAG: hypothetical protein LBU97_04285 [Alistipes sp.]|jgi:hypothetical protein|nr:hypothetical protein [Alistipes sp.]